MPRRFHLGGVIVLEPDADLLIVLEVEVVDAEREVVLAERLVRERAIGPGVAVGDGSVVALAGVGGGVAGGAECVVEVGARGVEAAVPEVAVGAVVVGIEAGDEGGAAGQAPRAGGVGAAEEESLTSEAVQVRGGDGASAVAGERVGAQLVAGDEDDGGLGRRGHAALASMRCSTAAAKRGS